jgi:hypothetical protein
LPNPSNKTDSIQFAIGTPLFRQKLKVSDANIAIILSTAGPISGFLVQPVIGVLSDACQFRFGRRRPFILGGALLCGTASHSLPWPWAISLTDLAD